MIKKPCKKCNKSCLTTGVCFEFEVEANFRKKKKLKGWWIEPHEVHSYFGDNYLDYLESKYSMEVE